MYFKVICVILKQYIEGVISMLIEFRFQNYRSFRDEATLSMEATGLSSFKKSLIPLSSTTKLLPAAAIFGKNGGGKSNVIRAFWLAVQFIRNAQRTQHERATIPVNPFALNDYSMEDPTEFHFVYTVNGIKYWYGFSATRDHVIAEYLYHAPKGQKALIFSRVQQQFTFTEEKTKRSMIGEMVAENQLFFSVACTMNDGACVSAMRWFRDHIFFSRDYPDIPRQLLAYSEDNNMLKAISDYAKAADLGIQDMHFEFDSKELVDDTSLPDTLPDNLRTALVQFMPLSLWKTLPGQALDKDRDTFIRILGPEGADLQALDEIEKQVTELLTPSLEVESENRIQERLTNDQMLRGAQMIGGAFCVLLGVIGLAGIFTNTFGFLRQRKREFARYLAVGMDSGEMRKIFCIEAAVIAGRPILLGLGITVPVTVFMTSASHLEFSVFLEEAPLVPVSVYGACIILAVALAYWLGVRRLAGSDLSGCLRDDALN